MTLKDILITKTVSVWGLGYLGYTAILKLQQNGFNVVAYDINPEQIAMFKSGRYPNKSQVASWSKMGSLPKLDYENIKIASSPKQLFKSSCLHIIAIPELRNTIKGANITSKLAQIFSQNLKSKKNAPLIVFQSAHIPGYIESHFVDLLKDNKILCGTNYYLGALFRTDWSIEAFINQTESMPIAGACTRSLDAIKQLCAYLNISTIEFKNLKEAEIYINSVGAIQVMANDFVRELALGYPDINMRRISKHLLDNVTLKNSVLNMGTGGERLIFAVSNLIEGSSNANNLRLLKEFQDINISSVLNYAEYITRHGYKSVAILGIAYEGNQRDIMFSPAVTLADYLIKNSAKVLLNDPFFTKDEIQKIIKGVKIVDFPNGVFSADVVILASSHNAYKYISQNAINKINKRTKLIIDNYGIWSHLSFGKNVKYHQVGDGKLNLTK